MTKTARRSASTTTLLTKYGYDKEPWLGADGKYYETENQAVLASSRARYSPRPGKIPFNRPRQVPLNYVLQDFRTELGKAGPDKTRLEAAVDYPFWQRAKRVGVSDEDTVFARKVIHRYRAFLRSLISAESVETIRTNAPAVAALVSRNPSQNDLRYMSTSELLEFVTEVVKKGWPRTER